MREAVAGIDAGGTRTRAAVVALDGEVLGVGESGAGHPRDADPATVAARFAAALEEARVAATRMRAAFFGVAGTGDERGRCAAEEAVDRLGLGVAVGMDHDLRIAHAGALAGSPGVVAVAGTGAAAYGRSADGDSHRAGGWGSRLDDGGSSVDLGRRGLSAVLRAADGRAEPTVLTERLLAEVGLGEPREITERAEAEGFPRATLARLGGRVVAAAEEDAVAARLVDRATDDLSIAVAAVTRRLGLAGGATVASVGGLTDAVAYRRALHAAIQRRLPAARVARPILPPTLGAALLAMEWAGVTAGDTEIGRMRRSGPRSSG